MLRLTVGDNGLGIAAEKQPLAFDDFNRLGRENLDVEGTGLGLALTKKTIEAMGGSIGFQSTEGEGSSFWIDIPLAEGSSVIIQSDPAAAGKSDSA